MGDKTKITWVQNEDGTPGHTFNPVWGCTKVSPGCDHCYAESMSNRFGKWWGQGTPRREFGDKHWNDPLRWNRKAEKTGIRHRVFCASMADVFDKDWPDGTRERLWALIKATPWLDWIIVTKRIGNAKKMLPANWGDGYPNVWLLITVVNQEEAARDVPKLLDTPAMLRGLSIEPQIESIDLTDLETTTVGVMHHQDALNGNTFWPSFDEHGKTGGRDFMRTDKQGLNWVICGAESGPCRRSFNEDWARSLRDQCCESEVPFFLKQMPGGNTRKGVIETPELDGQQWVQLPRSDTPNIAMSDLPRLKIGEVNIGEMAADWFIAFIRDGQGIDYLLGTVLPDIKTITDEAVSAERKRCAEIARNHKTFAIGEGGDVADAIMSVQTDTKTED